MIIEVDEYKKRISGYEPERSEDFHVESGKLADKDFIYHLKLKKYPEVVLMAGGTASGKTEFCSSYLNSENFLVYDATLREFVGFKTKLDKIKRYARNKPAIKVVLVIPSNWKAAFEVFLSRERKMHPSVFFETHIKSKLTVAKVLKETNIIVDFHISRVNRNTGGLEFVEVVETNRERLARNLVLMAKDLHSRAEHDGLKIDVNYDKL